MKGQHKTRHVAYPLTALWTNVLAGSWGAVAAYILFDSLFITHKNRCAVAALFPLVSAWATLERKRWGRLALMGLSLTTVLLFALMAGLFTRFHYAWQTEARTLAASASALLVSYGIGIWTAIGLLTLATVTGGWLCLPQVAAEFNHNKRLALIRAQRGIATVVVGCWAAFIALTPLMKQDGQDMGRSVLRARPRGNPHRIAHRLADASDSSRATRSELSDSRR